MKKFDHDGLLITEYQGKLFEKSVELNCSSPIFMRRFLHSNLLEKLDNTHVQLLSLDVVEGLRDLVEQYGDEPYGKEKYSTSALFWMGYMYRYIAYTREQPVSFVMKKFNYKQLYSLYYPYHTQDPEWCISNLLELNHLTEDYFDNNWRLKKIMKESGYY